MLHHVVVVQVLDIYADVHKLEALHEERQVHVDDAILSVLFEPSLSCDAWIIPSGVIIAPRTLIGI